MREEIVEKLYTICNTSGIVLRNDISLQKQMLVEGTLSEFFGFKSLIWDKKPLRNYIKRTLKDADRGLHRKYVGYLYSICFTDIVYDPGTVFDSASTKSILSPPVYNESTLEPLQSITLFWNPLSTENNREISEKEKNIIRGKLEQVLESPALFRPEGSRICTLMYYVK